MAKSRKASPDELAKKMAAKMRAQAKAAGGAAPREGLIKKAAPAAKVVAPLVVPPTISLTTGNVKPVATADMAMKAQTRIALADRFKKLRGMSDVDASNSARALLDNLKKKFPDAPEAELLGQINKDPDAIINKFAPKIAPAAKPAAPAAAPAPAPAPAPAAAPKAQPIIKPTKVQVAVKPKMESTLPPAAKPLVDDAIAAGESRDIAEARSRGIMTNDEVAAARKKAGRFVPIDELNKQHKDKLLAEGARARASAVAASKPQSILRQAKPDAVTPAPAAPPPKLVTVKPAKPSVIKRAAKGAKAATPAVVPEVRPTLTTGGPSEEIVQLATPSDRGAALTRAEVKRRGGNPGLPNTGRTVVTPNAGARGLIADKVNLGVSPSVASVRAAQAGAAARTAGGAAETVAGNAASVAGKTMKDAKTASLLRKGKAAIKGVGRGGGALGLLGRVALPVGVALTAWELGQYAYGQLAGNRNEGTVRGMEDLAGYQENTRQEEELRQAEGLNSNLRRIESSTEMMMSRLMNERDERMSDLAQVILRNEGSLRAAAVPSAPSFIERYMQMKGGM